MGVCASPVVTLGEGLLFLNTFIFLNAIEGSDLDNEVLRRRYNKIKGSLIIVEEGSVSAIYLAKL